MRHRVGTVRRQADLEQVVVLQLEIVAGRRTGRHVLRQHDNSVVGRADAYFVLGAEHAQRLDAAYLAFLDFESVLLSRGIKRRIDRRDDHFLSGGHVRGAADDLSRRAVAQIDRRDMQLIGIGMLLACKYVADDHSCESSRIDSVFSSASTSSPMSVRIRAACSASRSVSIYCLSQLNDIFIALDVFLLRSGRARRAYKADCERCRRLKCGESYEKFVK